MVVTPSGPPGHLVLIHVVSVENLERAHVLILNQCMEEMIAQVLEIVLTPQIVWIGIAQVMKVF